MLESKWLYIGIAGVLGLLLLRNRNQVDRVQSTVAEYQRLADEAKAKADATAAAAAQAAQDAYKAAVEKANAEHALFDKIEKYVYE